MVAAILIFFLAIFVGFALLGVTTYLYSRRLKSKNVKHFSSSGDYTAIDNSHEPNGNFSNELDPDYIYTPGGYIEREAKHEGITDYSGDSTDYSSSYSDSSSSYNSSSDFSSCDSGSSSSSSD